MSSEKHGKAAPSRALFRYSLVSFLTLIALLAAFLGANLSSISYFDDAKGTVIRKRSYGWPMENRVVLYRLPTGDLQFDSWHQPKTAVPEYPAQGESEVLSRWNWMGLLLDLVFCGAISIISAAAVELVVRLTLERATLLVMASILLVFAVLSSHQEVPRIHPGLVRMKLWHVPMTRESTTLSDPPSYGWPVAAHPSYTVESNPECGLTYSSKREWSVMWILADIAILGVVLFVGGALTESLLRRRKREQSPQK